jgi:hypothetical protein
MYRYFGVSYAQEWDLFGTFSKSTTKSATFSLQGEASYSTLRAAAYNAAYERLKSQVSDRAGWAENIAQINKTRKSIIERSVQLANVAKSLRKGDFVAVAKALRTPIPSGVSNRKAASQNFLEWEYGVKPLISDLQSSMQILLSDPGERAVKGRALERISRVTKSGNSTSSAYAFARDAVEGTITMTCRTGVRVVNPNLYLANQMGLIDLALPWKLVPFSFVVDWFVNVEQVISSVTDWYGLQLVNPHYTEFLRGQQTYVSNDLHWISDGRSWGSNVVTQRSHVELIRTLGLPSPTIVVKPFKGFSLERGLQAISLVLSVLGK